MINIGNSSLLPDYQRLTIAGFSAIAAVTAQTCCLTWIRTLIEGQSRTGQHFLQILKRVFASRNFKHFYCGEFSRYRYTALARCGDQMSNVAVISYFKSQQNTSTIKLPIFLQTVFSWVGASAWRLALLPLDILNLQTVRGSLSVNRYIAKLKFRKDKRMKSDIIPLYSWFLVQNYLMDCTRPVKYEEDASYATFKNSAIGFVSMGAYDIYKTIVVACKRQKGEAKRYNLDKITLKGLYGVIFCNVTQIIYEKFGSKEQV